MENEKHPLGAVPGQDPILEDLLSYVRNMRNAQKHTRLSGPASWVHEAHLWENRVDKILEKFPKPPNPVQGKLKL